LMNPRLESNEFRMACILFLLAIIYAHYLTNSNDIQAFSTLVVNRFQSINPNKGGP
jgi:hypothetical protein